MANAFQISILQLLFDRIKIISSRLLKILMGFTNTFTFVVAGKYQLHMDESLGSTNYGLVAASGRHLLFNVQAN